MAHCGPCPWCFSRCGTGKGKEILVESIAGKSVAISVCRSILRGQTELFPPGASSLFLFPAPPPQRHSFLLPPKQFRSINISILSPCMAFYLVIWTYRITRAGMIAKVRAKRETNIKEEKLLLWAVLGWISHKRMSFWEKHENKFAMVKIYDPNHSQTHACLVEAIHEQLSCAGCNQSFWRDLKRARKKIWVQENDWSAGYTKRTHTITHSFQWGAATNSSVLLEANTGATKPRVFPMCHPLEGY